MSMWSLEGPTIGLHILGWVYIRGQIQELEVQNTPHCTLLLEVQDWTHPQESVSWTKDESGDPRD
jgi:hypothetical protein